MKILTFNGRPRGKRSNTALELSPTGAKRGLCLSLLSLGLSPSLEQSLAYLPGKFPYLLFKSISIPFLRKFQFLT